MKDEKKKKFVQVFALAVIMLLIASSTYAYFAAQVGEASSTDIIVNTSTVDSLTFETGEAISISATQSNFGSGVGNQSGSTYASATLVANNDTNVASALYSIYLNISTNEFEYTTSEEYAELILIVTDEDGNLVTSIDGLNYTSVTDGEGNTLSGFDITGYIGSIAITEKHEIISYGIETDKWTVEVVFVNLSTDQSWNAGKELSAKLTIMQSGNTLQAVGSSSYSEKIWAYKDSITSIIFDDSGATISDYTEVYDISDAKDNSILAYLVNNKSYLCYYDGELVYSYDNLDASSVTSESCSTVYKLTDEDETQYYDSTLMDYYIDPHSVSWDSESMTCVIDGLEEGSYSLYTWFYVSDPGQKNCKGYAYAYVNETSENYYVGIENVGHGDYIADSIDGTYTVYIESNNPIFGNEDMSYWFYEFTALNIIEGIENLVTYNVTDMSYMFYDCTSLTTLDLSNFSTLDVTNMSYMFFNSGLVSLNLDNFNTSKVTTIEKMFYNCNNLLSLDLNGWDLSNAKKFSYLFYHCNALTSLDLTGWNTSNATTMSYMFYGCSSLNLLDLSSFDTSNVKDMSFMFANCLRLTSLDLSGFNTSKVTGMSYMFSLCQSLKTLDLSNWDTSNVTTMDSMFQKCIRLTSLDLSNWTNSNVKDMSGMFLDCNSLISLNLNNFCTSSVRTMVGMFYNCESLISLDLSSFDTSNVTNMSDMFRNCISLIVLDMSNADLTEVSIYVNSEMFYNNNSSIVVTVKDSTARIFIQNKLNEYNGGTVVIA